VVDEGVVIKLNSFLLLGLYPIQFTGRYSDMLCLVF
jgi:hypothetical protein